MDKSKLLLTTVIAGLGVGATKVLKAHKNTLENITNNQKSKLKSAVHIYDVYSKLNTNQKALVAKTFLRIIPKSDLSKSLNYQIDIYNYLRILHYLSHRNEFHSHDASIILNMSLESIKRMKPALIKQHLIRPQVRFNNGINLSTSYVLHTNVNGTLNYLNNHYQSGQLVKPLVFNMILNNSIAFNIFRR